MGGICSFVAYVMWYAACGGGGGGIGWGYHEADGGREWGESEGTGE